MSSLKTRTLKIAAIAAAFALTFASGSVAHATPAVSSAANAKATAKNVVVTQAWVRASSFSDHTGGMTGVFAKITNRTSKTVTLTGGSSSFAPMVQVHQVVNGMMSEKAGGIKIAPGKSAILQPGGLHVMLMGLTKEVKPGTMVDIKLNFTNAKPISLKLLSKTADAGDEEYFATKK
jgi:copper(I)-binding protein